MNYIKSVLYLLFTFLSANVFAQKDNNSLLWEISGNGLERSSYLFGTIHIIDKEHFEVRKEIDSVFELSEQAAFEIKLDDIEALMKIQAWINLPEGKTIENISTPEQYLKIKTYFRDSLQTDIAEFNDQKPFVLYQLLITNYVEGASESFELYFLTKCMSEKKPVAGLERIDDQLKIFDEIPYEEQIEWVITAIDSANSYQKIWDELIATYKSEDLDKLEKLMFEGSPELEKYKNEFLHDRNKEWIPVIESLIKDKPTFIAVGAAHLAGKKGVIRLLRKEGYTVIPF